MRESINTHVVANKDFSPEDWANIKVPEYEKLLLVALAPLRENFIRGKYNIIIGEDASGRLCSLIVADVAKRMARAAQVKEPETRFIAGLRSATDEEINRVADQIREWVASTGGNILLVTEFIDSGDSVAHFLQAAHKANAYVDIVTAEARNDSVSLQKKIQDKIGADCWNDTVGEVALGQFGAGVLLKGKDVYQMTGVYKKDTFSAGNNKGEYTNLDAKNAATAISNKVAYNLFEELNPSLEELFKTLEVNFEDLVKMSEDKREEYLEWLNMVEIRASNSVNLKSTDELKTLNSFLEKVRFAITALGFRTLKVDIDKSRKLFEESLLAISEIIQNIKK